MNRQQKIKFARDLAVNGLPTVKPIPINYLVKKDGVYYFESDTSFQNPLSGLPEGVPMPINFILAT